MDSVHGPFSGVVEVDSVNRTLIINTNIVHIIQAKDPSKVDYIAFGIDNALIIDNTGIWRTKKSLENHLIAADSSEVILTAPGNNLFLSEVLWLNRVGC